MAGKQTWEFKRGEDRSKRIWVRAAVYTVGGKLFVAAKEVVDSDTADSKAVINKVLTDDNIVATNDAGDKAFLFTIAHSDTKDLPITDVTTYIGECKYLNASGKVTTYPKDNKTFFFQITPGIKNGDS